MLYQAINNNKNSSIDLRYLNKDTTPLGLYGINPDYTHVKINAGNINNEYKNIIYALKSNGILQTKCLLRAGDSVICTQDPSKEILDLKIINGSKRGLLRLIIPKNE